MMGPAVSESRGLTISTATRAPHWMRRWLIAAALYNLVWGFWVVLMPFALFDWVGAARPLYPQIWQCVGMIVGVYGLGYAIASRDPFRHWPIVLVGLLGKIFGPIGFAWAMLGGEFPAAFGWTILTNDLLWWVPFTLILLHAWRFHAGQGTASETEVERRPLDETLREYRLEDGRTLLEASDPGPIMLVMLRHEGCTFCRTMIAEVARQRASLAERGVSPVFVLPAIVDSATTLVFERYGVGDLPRVGDPTCALYRAIGLRRMGVRELFDVRLVVRSIKALVSGYGIGGMKGDGFQMPGIVVIERGQIVWAYRHPSAADVAPLDRAGCALDVRAVQATNGKPQPSAAV